MNNTNSDNDDNSNNDNTTNNVEFNYSEIYVVIVLVPREQMT